MDKQGSTVEDPLARMVLAGEIGEGETVEFDAAPDGEGLEVTSY